MQLNCLSGGGDGRPPLVRLALELRPDGGWTVHALRRRLTHGRTPALQGLTPRQLAQLRAVRTALVVLSQLNLCPDNHQHDVFGPLMASRSVPWWQMTEVPPQADRIKPCFSCAASDKSRDAGVQVLEWWRSVSLSRRTWCQQSRFMRRIGRTFFLLLSVQARPGAVPTRRQWRCYCLGGDARLRLRPRAHQLDSSCAACAGGGRRQPGGGEQLRLRRQQRRRNSSGGEQRRRGACDRKQRCCSGRRRQHSGAGDQHGGAFSGASGEARPGCHLLVSAFAK